MNVKVCILIVSLFVNDIHGVIYYLNESEYERMPPVYKLDDYEICLQQPTGIYCNVHFNLVSDSESELLNMIEEYSEQTRTHYNHSQLIHGVCVTRSCQTYVKDRTMVSKTSLEACLNETFMNEYRLKTQVTNFKCHSPLDAKEVFDTADKAVAFLLLLILMLNIIGSIYDLRNLQKIKENFLVCFSIQRNWKRLISYTTNADPRIESLRGFSGIRCIILFGVIMVHCSWPYLRAVHNSHDMELIYYNLRRNVILSGSLFIQANILMSGFFLAYNMEIYSENNAIRWYMIPKTFLMRYFRITPVYAVVIAVIATWLKFLGPGPLWEESGNLIFSHCRSDWWRNLLYINNYKYNSQCMLHGWYLAADMQLFCVGIVLCMLLRKNSWRKSVLTSIFFLGAVIITVHTYVRDLDPVLVMAPGPTRTLFESDPTFNETYKMGHANIPSFIMGMILGYTVYEWQKTGVDVLKNKMLRYLYWALIPVGLAMMFSGEVFYRDAPRDPLAVRVAYAAFAKPLFATVMAMFIAGTIFKIDNEYRKLLEWNKWTIASRLSFCVYIIHMPLIRLYVGLSHSLLIISNTNLVLLALGVTTASYIISVPLWLLVETPFTQLVKYYLIRSHQQNLTKNDYKNFRDLHFEISMEHYYEGLNKALMRFGYKSEELYPMEDFDFELKKILPAGLELGIASLLLLTMEKKDALKENQDSTQQLNLDDFPINPTEH